MRDRGGGAGGGGKVEAKPKRGCLPSTPLHCRTQMHPVAHLRVQACHLRVQACNLRVQAGHLRVQACHLRVQACNLRVQACHLRVQACNLRVQACHLRMQACHLRVQACNLRVQAYPVAQYLHLDPGSHPPMRLGDRAVHAPQQAAPVGHPRGTAKRNHQDTLQHLALNPDPSSTLCPVLLLLGRLGGSSKRLGGSSKRGDLVWQGRGQGQGRGWGQGTGGVSLCCTAAATCLHPLARS